MYAPTGVKTSTDFPIPEKMKAWVLGDPGELKFVDKPVPVPKKAEVLVRIDAVAICATDLDVIYEGPAGDDPGRPALQQELDAGPRVHGHGGRARPGRRRVQNRRARLGGDPRRLRPVQALPHGHVHVVPQLRPELRRGRQGPPRQRLHHGRRLRRVRRQQHQHAGQDRRRHERRGGDPGRHRRHRHVRADRARRPGRGRERRRHRPRPDRPARRCRRQGARAPIR